MFGKWFSLRRGSAGKPFSRWKGRKSCGNAYLQSKKESKRVFLGGQLGRESKGGGRKGYPASGWGKVLSTKRSKSLLCGQSSGEKVKGGTSACALGEESYIKTDESGPTSGGKKKRRLTGRTLFTRRMEEVTPPERSCMRKKEEENTTVERSGKNAKKGTPLG